MFVKFSRARIRKTMVKKTEKIIDSLRSVLFPEFYGGGVSSEMFYAQLLECVPAAEARELTDFVAELKRMLDMDIEAAYNGDPAAWWRSCHSPTGASGICTQCRKKDGPRRHLR